LSDALLASYLLGVDQIQTEVSSQKSEVSFAEDDDQEQGAKSKGRRSKTKDQRTKFEGAFDLPPDEAIEYFEKKKIVRKQDFNRLSREAQQAAFTVSRVYQDDVLAGFKDEIDDALRKGRTQQETIKRFKSILDGAAHEQLGEFHLETVFRTNMMTAYGTGRRRGMEEVTDAFPYWQYWAVMDDRTRPSHAALNGIIQRADSEFWATHYPQWEWLCRCSATPTDTIPEGYDPANPSGAHDEYGEPAVQISYGDDHMPVKAQIGTSLVDLTVHSNFSGIPRGASLLTAIEAGVERAQASRKGTRGKS
jgi:SPP1 gp7 family putative phage head morphogenesis protein